MTPRCPFGNAASGRPLPHESAALHVTGEAVYVDDLPELDGTLHAAPILSPIAHGRLLGVDSGAALDLSRRPSRWCSPATFRATRRWQRLRTTNRSWRGTRSSTRAR